MTQQEKIKSLTWKYFWKQKWNEIKGPLKVIVGVALIIGLSYLMITFEVVGFIFFVLAVLYALGIIIMVLISWIRDNWKQAKERATKEVKNGRR